MFFSHLVPFLSIAFCGFAWRVRMNALRDTMGPVIRLGVRAGTYSRWSSRSLVSETSFNGAIRDPGRKRESIDRTIGLA